MVGNTVLGREFFEEIIRDNLDLGRPDRIQLVFDPMVTKKAPRMFHTRVIQDGVHPSLIAFFKSRDCTENTYPDQGAQNRYFLRM